VFSTQSTATTESNTLSLHDALPIWGISQRRMTVMRGTAYGGSSHFRFAPSRAVLQQYAEILDDDGLRARAASDLFWDRIIAIERSEEHTSELQSRFDLVCRLLLEKK